MSNPLGARMLAICLAMDGFSATQRIRMTSREVGAWPGNADSSNDPNDILDCYYFTHNTTTESKRWRFDYLLSSILVFTQSVETVLMVNLVAPVVVVNGSFGLQLSRYSDRNLTRKLLFTVKTPDILMKRSYQKPKYCLFSRLLTIRINLAFH